MELKNERETLREVAVQLKSMKLGALDDGRAGIFFNLSTPAVQNYRCGTVACIGGHAWLIENPGDFAGARNFVLNVMSEDRLWPLFYYDGRKHSNLEALEMKDVTPKQAAKAVEAFLAGNEGNPWEKVR